MTITYPSLDSLSMICLSIHIGHRDFAFPARCHFLAIMMYLRALYDPYAYQLRITPPSIMDGSSDSNFSP